MKSSWLVLLIATVTMVACHKQDFDLVAPEDLLESLQNSTDTIQLISTRSTPVISSITGPTYLPYVALGKWQGNTPQCGPGNYFGYYVINTHNNDDTDNYWFINGTGFGSTAGLVTSSSSGVTFQVLSWSNTLIKVRPKANWLLDYKTNLTITVKPGTGPFASKVVNVLGMIKKGRGFGQCTWEAAYQRLVANLSIPTSAYSYTGSITVAYVPKKYDIVHWGTSHTAIIMTTPTTSNSNGITTFTFQLRERNHNCGEYAVTTTKTFKKSANSIIQGIKSANSTLGTATKYFR